MRYSQAHVVLSLGGQLGLVVLEYAASFQEDFSFLGLNLRSVLPLSKYKIVMYLLYSVLRIRIWQQYI